MPTFVEQLAAKKKTLGLPFEPVVQDAMTRGHMNQLELADSVWSASLLAPLMLNEEGLSEPISLLFVVAPQWIALVLVSTTAQLSARAGHPDPLLHRVLFLLCL